MSKLKSLIKEISGHKNFWVLPNGDIKTIAYNHALWFVENVPCGLHIDKSNLNILDAGGKVHPAHEVYQLAFKMEYIRLVTIGSVGHTLFVEYEKGRPPKLNQMRNIKNLAIENQWKLADAETRREIEL